MSIIFDTITADEAEQELLFAIAVEESNGNYGDPDFVAGAAHAYREALAIVRRIER